MSRVIIINVHPDSNIYQDVGIDSLKDFLRAMTNEDTYQLNNIVENICRQYGINIDVQGTPNPTDNVTGVSIYGEKAQKAATQKAMTGQYTK